MPYSQYSIAPVLYSEHYNFPNFNYNLFDIFVLMCMYVMYCGLHA